MTRAELPLQYYIYTRKRSSFLTVVSRTQVSEKGDSSRQVHQETTKSSGGSPLALVFRYIVFKVPGERGNVRIRGTLRSRLRGAQTLQCTTPPPALQKANYAHPRPAKQAWLAKMPANRLLLTMLPD